uniref:Ubiquitin-like protease family profile domain-containing protein n=1 Tax=Brassica oleracea var. oleracea TaxID=109376 RepID=A0A0D3D3Y1_BRAOL
MNFVQKDFAQMFPRWDFDVEDPAAENIIKVMFNAKANWKWTMDCWEVTGTNPRVKKEVSAAEKESGVKEESSRPRKKARKEVRKEASVEASKVPSTEARAEAHSEASTSIGGMTKEQIEKNFRDIADAMRDGFGMCVKEIKFLGDKMEAVEKKVGITKKGTASTELQITTSSPPKRGHEPRSESVNGAKVGHNDPQEPSSSKDLSLVIANEPEEKPTEQSGEPSILVLDKGVPTDTDLQKGETRRQRKKDDAMVLVRGKSARAKKLATSQQSPFNENSTAKVIIPNKRVGQVYDPFAPFDKKMSKVLTDWVKLDPRFYHTLRTTLEWLNDEHIDTFINVLRQRCQDNPHHFRSERLCFLDHVWGLDVDDIYAPVNFRNEHWIAMWISISKKHIVVWDNIISHIRPAELDVVMEPFVTMTLEPYTYERVTVGVPECRAGDCGVFALKYIECYALGMSFPPEFCKKNAKAIREKIALDIFKETLEGHSKENEDNDENLGTYDEQG